MKTKVIYGDGSIETVHVSKIDDLAEEGKIAAYQIYDKWVEVRRKQVTDGKYQGPERRKSHFTIYLDRYQR
jgi:hypothetical protein